MRRVQFGDMRLKGTLSDVCELKARGWELFRTMNSFSSFVRNVAPAARINFGDGEVTIFCSKGAMIVDQQIGVIITERGAFDVAKHIATKEGYIVRVFGESYLFNNR